MKLEAGAALAPPILVLAPARDAALAQRVLAAAGHAARVCAGAPELIEAVRAGAERIGALLLAEECLTDRVAGDLQALLRRQPAGADLPVLLVTSATRAAQDAAVFDALGNVTVLTRPMALDALTSAAAAALRARRRQFELVALMNEQREQAIRKDEFLAMLAHELRNPLAPVRYAAQALAATPLEARQRKLTDVIGRQVAHMGRIIDQLLDVSRLTRGKITVELQPLELGVLVRQAVEAAQEQARAKDIPLHVRIASGVWVRADATRMVQAVGNLLDNALKFSERGQPIEVTLASDGAHATLEIRDDGDGMEAREIPYLFQPFTQGDKTLERAKGGLGLGLSVVDAVVRLHHGSVRAESAGLGRGSVFRVVLPLAEPGEVAATPAPRRDVASPMDASRCRVLLIEDNVDAAETLGMLLEASACDVSLVHDGAAGVEAARRLRPDVIVCDVGLPGMSGYEVVRAVRADPGISGTRMIAVTGYANPEDRAAAMDAGFDAHFAKPVDPVALLAEIRIATERERHGLTQELPD